MGGMIVVVHVVAAPGLVAAGTAALPRAPRLTPAYPISLPLRVAENLGHDPLEVKVKEMEPGQSRM